MSEEMRFCRSRRACSTFVSASVGGSQEKSSTSGERKAQGTWCARRSSRPPRPRSRGARSSSPHLHRSGPCCPLSPLGSMEVTHRQSACLRLRPLRGGRGTRAEMTHRGFPDVATPLVDHPAQFATPREPSRRGFPAVTPLGSQRAGVAAQAPFCPPAPPPRGFPFPHWPDHWRAGQWRHHCNPLANSGRLCRPQYLPLQPARRAGRDHSHFLYLSAYLHVWCPSLSIPCLP